MSAGLRVLIGLSLSVFLCGCGPSVRPLETGPAPAEPELEVLVVPLTGVLGTKEQALCLRALREAQDRGMRVVFRMETAGGPAESWGEAQVLIDHLQDPEMQRRVGTTALLSGPTQGGAAYLALCCDQLYFLRDGSIGAITPLPSMWEQIRELTEEDAERQRFRTYADELKQRLLRRKNPLTADALKLCEGMADPTMRLVHVTVRERGMQSSRIVEASELTGLEAAGIEILDQTEETQPVVLEPRRADEVGISRGTVQSMEHLCTDVLLVDRERVGVLQPSWSETMVDWLGLLQPGLLVLGFVLLLLEVKTPGVGLPGLLGTVFLALAMFYSYLVGLAEVVEIVLFFLGIAALIVEIFLLPGLIVFGAVGFLCLVFSLILSRQTFVLPSSASEEEILFYNLLHLTGLFLSVLVFAALLWRFLPRIPLLNRLYLRAPEPASGAAVVAPAARGADARKALVGSVGTAATVLRPAGVMEIDGERVDVVTMGDYVEMGRRVRVIAVHGNRVTVEPVHDGDGDGDGERGSVGVILLLMVLGVVFLVAEVFFVSFGILFALSGAAIFGAVFLAFQESTAFGTTVLIIEAVIAPLAMWGAFRLLPHTRMGRALMLEGPRPEEVSGRAMAPALADLMDKTGETLSALRPSGFARIDGRKVDVVTRGEMIEPGCRVRVVEVLGNRVVVKAESPPR